jgi:pimeloyl-ACP methyl ester carboxylesterase
MPTVSANGARFHVQRLETSAGAGAPTVVFVHGLVTDNLSSFYYTLAGPVVAAGARAILYDLRGHGKSDRPPGGYTTRDGVTDMCALLDALGVAGPVYLVGNSYGGLIATGLALAAPERVAGLAVIEAACAGPGAAAWMEDILNTLTVAALSLEHEQTAQRLAAAGKRKLARLATSAGLLLNETSLIEDLGSERPLEAAALEAIGCPVLGVFGERSELRPAADELRRHVRDCRIEIIPGLAHTVLREATALLSSIVLEWLQPRTAAS